MLRNVLTACMSACITLTLAAQKPASRAVGVLLLAHGGSASWDANVRDIAGAVDEVHPTEVAFGMASRSAIQKCRRPCTHSQRWITAKAMVVIIPIHTGPRQSTRTSPSVWRQPLMPIRSWLQSWRIARRVSAAPLPTKP